MEQTFQQILVFGTLALAGLYLARFYWKRQKSKTGCPGCKLAQAARPKPTDKVIK